MKTIFQVLHELIHASSVTSKQRQEVLSQAQKLPEQFIRAACMTSSKKELAQLVRSAQLNASMLLNQLHERQPATAAWYKTVEDKLTAFLHLLRKKFNSHFDDRQPMPEVLWIPAKEKIRAGLDNLVINSEAAEQLVQYLKAEFTMSIKNGPLSFAQANYWTYLLEMLNDPPKTDDIHAGYIHLLITHNFNSSLFVYYILEHYARNAAIADDATAHWTNSYCQVNRTHTLPGMQLYPKQVSCKKMLRDAIAAEMSAVQNSPNEDQPVNTGQPIFLTSLTIPQLGVFFRLLVDAGIIIADNKRLLVENLSRIFKTRYQTSPSPDKLRNKFYSFEPAAITIIRAQLVNMLSKLGNH